MIFIRSPTDFRLLNNTIISMNTVAEQLGLYQSGYPPDVSRNERHREAQRIRNELNLTALQTCADALKHVRINKNQSILSSTGIDLNDRTTWQVGGHDLVNVAHTAYATLREIPELK